MSEPYILTKESVTKEIIQMPSEALVTFYGISVYHEKYRFAMWILDELEKRGVNKEDIKIFEGHFSHFYNALLKQNDL